MTNVRGAALRSLAPGTGVYYNAVRGLRLSLVLFSCNELAYCIKADDFEPEWQQSLWSENYQRLRAIKPKDDPSHLQS